MGSRCCVTMSLLGEYIPLLFSLIKIWDCFGNEGPSLGQAQKNLN
jgi:hypothetical protein